MNVLLIKRGTIGDVLMTTPLIRQLRENNITIDYLTTNGAKAILENNIHIKNLIIVNEIFFSLKGFFKLCKLYFALRKNYDYVFILDKHFYFSMVAIIFKAKIIGFAREKIAKFFLDYYVDYYNIKQYQVWYYLRLLEVSLLGMPNYKDVKLDFLIDVHIKNKIEKFLNEKKIDSFIIIVNSGGNNKFENSHVRMLPDTSIIDLINTLSINNVVLLIGDKNDCINYKKYYDFIKNQSKVLNMAGLFTIQESTYLLHFANKIYTTDCGVLHLALSQNLHNKIFCFFGPTYHKHVLPETEIKFWANLSTYDVNYILYGKINKKLTNKDFFINFDVNCVN